MATYAVGDIQGCYRALKLLLKKVKFNADNDHLWVAGDLVNRGPDSLKSLRYIKKLGPSATLVLGNHDLHLLAHAYGVRTLNPKDTLAPILTAKDSDELLEWLQAQPLLHYDAEFDAVLVHAGIPPIWSIENALNYALEVEQALSTTQTAAAFFVDMYGNQPDVWQPSLEGTARLRLITNYLTRMRFCSPTGKLELQTKNAPSLPPTGFAPWYTHKHNKWGNTKILFGHWAALMGETRSKQFIGLDTGCVWGGALTMMRLEDGQFFAVDCPC